MAKPYYSSISHLIISKPSASPATTTTLQPSESSSREFAMTSSSALKLATACMLLLCVGSADLAQPVLASPSPSPSPPLPSQASAGELLLLELVEHDLAEELGLRLGRRQRERGGGNVGDICPSACQTCLVVCAATCVLSKVPIACFANCTVSSSCFGKTATPLPVATA